MGLKVIVRVNKPANMRHLSYSGRTAGITTANPHKVNSRSGELHVTLPLFRRYCSPIMASPLQWVQHNITAFS
ncbi:hypothetical protein C5167_026093 [Papaver somniferum]|nr:hypothetical protein C5167_026093 [Papaver somniferum]